MNIDNCPNCNSSEFKLILTAKNSEVLKCEKCQLEFLNSQPSEREILNLYKENYYFGGLADVKGYQNYTNLETSLEKEAIKRIRVINNYTSKKRLLDVGAGTGTFLSVAKQKRYNVAANDISSYAISKLRKITNLTYQGKIIRRNFPKEYFDIVTAWDVIEHIPNLGEAISAINYTLKKGGYIFLTTPNTDSIDARLLGKYWYGYKKIPEHIVFFNKKSIKYLLESNGFKVMEIISWGFVRDFDFIVEKLLHYSQVFIVLKFILKFLKLGKIEIFFPIIDFLIIARKV